MPEHDPPPLTDAARAEALSWLLGALTALMSVYAMVLATLPTLEAWLPRGTNYISAPLELMLLGVGVVFIRNTPFTWADAGLTRRGWRRAAAEGLLATLPLIVLAILGKWLWVQHDPLMRGARVLNHEALLARYGPIRILTFPAIYLALTLAQEAIARGVLLGVLRRVLGGPGATMRALLISTTLFGVTHAHLDPRWVAVALPVGLLFGLMFLRHGSLVGVTLCHALTGTFVFFVLAPS